MRTVISALLLGALGCSSRPGAATEEVQSNNASPVGHHAVPDHERAARLLQLTARLLELPRTLGVPERNASIRALASELEALGADVRLQPLTAKDPSDGVEYALTNVIGHFRQDAPRQFIIGTHFDTRPWADEDPNPSAHNRPVVGANDGTSGVAVALELASELRDTVPDDVGFAVVLFDGEELGRPGAGGYCAGSRHMAAHLSDPGNESLRRAAFGIVLDMVGDRDLEIVVEPNSQRFNPALNERLFSVAARDGFRAFDGSRQSVGIIDDHTFLSSAGVPSILVIDYEYPAWHTLADTLDKVDGQSLAAVFEVTYSTIVETLAAGKERR